MEEEEEVVGAPQDPDLYSAMPNHFPYPPPHQVVYILYTVVYVTMESWRGGGGVSFCVLLYLQLVPQRSQNSMLLRCYSLEGQCQDINQTPFDMYLRTAILLKIFKFVSQKVRIFVRLLA